MKSTEPWKSTVPWKARQPRATPRQRGPFSRQLNVREVKDDGLVLTIEAKPEECAAIAAESELPAVASLSVRYRIERRAGDRIELTGKLKARISQVCVVSLEPFESDVTQAIDLTFAPQAQPERIDPRDDRHRAPERSMPVTIPGSDDQIDPPDPIIDDTIDLGLVALEFLTLSLDLYPKKPGVHFTDVLIGEKDEPEPSAFAALERFKDRS